MFSHLLRIFYLSIKENIKLLFENVCNGKKLFGEKLLYCVKNGNVILFTAVVQTHTPTHPHTHIWLACVYKWWNTAGTIFRNWCLKARTSPYFTKNSPWKHRKNVLLFVVCVFFFNFHKTFHPIIFYDKWFHFLFRIQSKSIDLQVLLFLINLENMNLNKCFAVP